MDGMTFSAWLFESVAEQEGFRRAIEVHPNDMTSRGVYADWLEERNLASDEVLNFLRHTAEPATFVDLPDGKVWSGRCYTMDEIIAFLRRIGHTFFSSDNMRFFGSRLSSFVRCGPGGIFFVMSNNDGFVEPIRREYNVYKFDPNDKDRGPIDSHDDYVYSDLRSAKRAAQQLALAVLKW